MRELYDREKQAARNKAIAAGMDMSEAEGDSNRPVQHLMLYSSAHSQVLQHKRQLYSKFDRQVDRRSFGDRRTLFESVCRIVLIVLVQLVSTWLCIVHCATYLSWSVQSSRQCEH